MAESFSEASAEAMVAVFGAIVAHAEETEALATRLGELYAQGRAEWPAIVLSPEAFARHLGAVMKSEPSLDAALADVRGADLYLAAACVFRIPDAERAVSKTYFERIPSYVARIDPSPAFADEVRQELSLKLFVAEPGEAPRIARYTGRGSFEGFLRRAAANIAQDLKRARSNERLNTTKESSLPAKDLDPEILLLKKRFAAEFERAFSATVAQLTPDERKVLKLHYLQGLSIDEVGAACDVSRATAARWLAKARTRIVQLTYTSFAQAAGPNSASPESMLAMVKSELGASLAKTLASD